MIFKKKDADDFQLAKHSYTRKYTFIVAPNTYGQTHKFTISSFWLKNIIIVSCVAVVAVVMLVSSYVSLLTAYDKSKQDLATLQSINKEQQMQLYDMSELAKDVEEKLVYLDLLETKIQTVINESSSVMSPEDQLLVAEIDAKLAQMRDSMIAVGGDSDVDMNYYVASASMDTLDVTTELATIKDTFSSIEQNITAESDNYTGLSAEVTEYDRVVNRLPNSNPLPNTKYNISEYFGYRTYPRVEFHSGMDLACPTGSEIHPVSKGTVEYAGWYNEYGYCVIINHGNGYESLYGHLSVIYCSVGDEVTVDNVIGGVGSTGYSTGSHLHLEIRQNGVRVDPSDYIDL